MPSSDFAVTAANAVPCIHKDKRRIFCLMGRGVRRGYVAPGRMIPARGHPMADCAALGAQDDQNRCSDTYVRSIHSAEMRQLLVKEPRTFVGERQERARTSGATGLLPTLPSLLRRSRFGYEGRKEFRL